MEEKRGGEGIRRTSAAAGGREAKAAVSAHENLLARVSTSLQEKMLGILLVRENRFDRAILAKYIGLSLNMLAMCSLGPRQELITLRAVSLVAVVQVESLAFSIDNGTVNVGYSGRYGVEGKVVLGDLTGFEWR